MLGRNLGLLTLMAGTNFSLLVCHFGSRLIYSVLVVGFASISSYFPCLPSNLLIFAQWSRYCNLNFYLPKDLMFRGIIEPEGGLKDFLVGELYTVTLLGTGYFHVATPPKLQ